MKKSVCLNMIVKNEKHVIVRCLESVRKFIDYWVIVDTGSTDGTQELIREYLKDLPGELHERPWVNFGHNRNEALCLAKAKADYLLFIDADDKLHYPQDFVLPPLEADAYYITQKEQYKETFREHTVMFLVNNAMGFQWKGVLHEYIQSQRAQTIQHLPGITSEYINDGARSKDPFKIAKDIQMLKEGLREEPENRRYLFYLARTYWSNKNYRLSLKHFEKRAMMGGDEQEIYHSLLYTAVCQRLLNYPPEVFVKNFCKAYTFRPIRTEALYELARYYTDTANHFLGYLMAKCILSTPKNQDNLFVESWISDWGAPLYLFLNAKELGYLDEAKATLRHLLQNTQISATLRKQFKLEQWQRYFEENSNLHTQGLMVS